MDEMKIMDRDMIISAILHDSLEDTHDLSPELMEHCFGTDVITMVKLLSKIPKEGYIERLNSCHNWKVLAIKACDRLDNLRSLMIPGNTLEFQKKQVQETRDKYFSIFDRMVTLVPSEHVANVSIIRDEIRRLIERYSTIIEIQEGNPA
jgi:(p)ppGpp synthase/HD superfamily hydrolase